MQGSCQWTRCILDGSFSPNWAPAIASIRAVVLFWLVDLRTVVPSWVVCRLESMPRVVHEGTRREFGNWVVLARPEWCGFHVYLVC